MPRNLHHANLLVGSREAAELYLRSLYDGLGIKLANNPDFVAFRTETFGINEARELRLLAARKAFVGTKIFLISPSHLTLEAQNALLKTFEDPFPDTYFFLSTTEISLVIPTLLSRMETIRVSDSKTSELGDAEIFLTLTIKDRILFAKKFADEDMNLAFFLDNLLLLLRNLGKTQTLIEKVYNLRRFANDSSVLPRLVIEHLSLVLQ